MAYADPPIASKVRGFSIDYDDTGDEPYIIRGARVAPGIRFMPSLARKILEALWLDRIEKAIGFRFDIVWLFENSRFYNLDFAGERVRIYHQVDLNQNFHVFEALASSDLRLTNTSKMLNLFESLGFDGHKIDHGVAAGAPKVNIPHNSHVQAGRLAAAYVGNLDISYLDIGLIAKLISSFPQVDFHLIGTVSAGNSLHALTVDMKNVFWWGRIKSEDIVPTLRSMDVLLLTYDSACNEDQLANPHKMMEYMASGTVTVATFTLEYEDKDHLLAMVKRNQDYITLFSSVIGTLEYWNSSELRSQRIAFAQDNTYMRQVDRISDLLSRTPSVQKKVGYIRL